MSNYIVFDAKGKAIAIVPAESPEEARNLVLDEPSLTDATKIIPEEETWAYKSKNQPAEMAQGIQDETEAQHQADLANEPWWKKVGRNVTTAVLPNAMAAANKGVPDENIARAITYGDVPMYAGLATGNVGLAAAGSIAGNTAGQFAGRGEYDATEGGINTAFAGLPFIGSKVANAVGPAMQRIAPSVAYYAVKPTMKAMGNPNPPNFEMMLKEGLFPYFGGLKASYDNVVKHVTPLRSALQKAIKDADEQGVTISIDNIKSSAFNAIDADKKLLPTQRENIKNALNKEIDAYYQKYSDYVGAPSHDGGMGISAEIPVVDAYAQKQGAQASAFEKASQNDLGGARADKILARSINNELGADAPMVRSAAKAMSPYEAMIAAMERRLGVPAQSNMGLGLYDYQMMQAASELTGGSKLAQFAGLAGKNMLSSTGGAQMLYDAGGSLMRGRPGLSSLSLATANQAPSLDYFMSKIFDEGQ